MNGFEQPAETEDAKKKPKRNIWLRGLLAVVAPAALAGVFGLIPNLFDRFTAPKAKLTYSVISSPAINVGSSYNRIYSISIENSGSTKLTGVTASVVVSGGKIERSSLGDRDGEQTRLEAGADQSRVIVRSMFPKERVSAVLLVSTLGSLVKPSFSVRSEEVLGEYLENSATGDESSSSLPVFLASLGALVATIVAFVLPSKERQSYRLLSDVLSGQIEAVSREDAIRTITDAIGDKKLTYELAVIGYSTTLAEFGHRIKQKASNVRRSKRNRYVAGLKAILLVPYVRESTRTLVKSWLLDSGFSLPKEVDPNSNLNNLILFRSAVSELFLAECGAQDRKRFGWLPFRGD